MTRIRQVAVKGLEWGWYRKGHFVLTKHLKLRKSTLLALMLPVPLGPPGMCQPAQFASHVYFHNGKMEQFRAGLCRQSGLGLKPLSVLKYLFSKGVFKSLQVSPVHPPLAVLWCWPVSQGHSQVCLVDRREKLSFTLLAPSQITAV